MTTGPDIILGVSRAVDAVKQRQAATRLERLSQELAGAVDTSAPLPESWPAEVRQAMASLPQASSQTSGPPDANTPGATTTAAPRSKQLSANAAAAAGSTNASPKEKAEAYTQFEAVLLQNMIEAMMPKDTEALMGKGTAGQIWKSMLSEKIAAEIARSGTLGIAKQIAAGVSAASHARPAAQMKVDQS